MNGWTLVAPLIQSWESLSETLCRQFDKLVECSDGYLRPLEDPLHLDLGTNRLFTNEREETYSDWLAWILQELAATGNANGAADVFQLLSISQTEILSQCAACSDSAKVFREQVIEQGHEGHKGRVDILIRYERILLIHIEVKVTDADRADLEKNKGYSKSLKGEYAEKEHIHVLLVTDSKRADYDDGFRVLKWSHIAKTLRRLATDHTKPLLLTAAMLLFAGTIEQRLYGLSKLRTGRAIAYLNEVLSEMGREVKVKMSEDQIDQARRLQFLKEGLTCYGSAWSAMQEFQAEIYRLSEMVVQKRWPDLAKAMGSELNVPGEPYVKVDPEKGPWEWAWVTSKATLSGLPCYFGIYWTKGVPFVVAMMDVGSRDKRMLLMKRIRECGLSVRVETYYKHEVSFLDQIQADQLGMFGDKLNKLIDEWVKVWKYIGGLRELTTESLGDPYSP